MSVKGNAKTKRKIIPVQVWMTEEFTLVRRISTVRGHERSRLAGTHVWHKMYSANPRRNSTR